VIDEAEARRANTPGTRAEQQRSQSAKKRPLETSERCTERDGVEKMAPGSRLGKGAEQRVEGRGDR
jgi:hypothetical protein